MPMVQALEEQPTATTTKNGASQPTGFASSFAKNLERTAQNGSASIKPNPKFLKKKGQDPVPKTGKPQKSKTPEKQAVAAELVKKNAERKQINKLIEAIKNLAQDQHVDNQKIESRVEQMDQATVQHLNELYTFIKNENKVLKDDKKVLKDDNKVLKDKIRVLDDKAEKAEAFNNKVLMDKIVGVETVVGNLTRSDTPLEETTGVKTLIKELTDEVKRSNRSLAECARMGDRFDDFLRANQSPRVRKDSKRQKRDRGQSPPPKASILGGGRNSPTNGAHSSAPTALQVPAPAAPPTSTAGVTPTTAPQGTIQSEPQVLREGSLATTVM